MDRRRPFIQSVTGWEPSYSSTIRTATRTWAGLPRQLRATRTCATLSRKFELHAVVAGERVADQAPVADADQLIVRPALQAGHHGALGAGTVGLESRKTVRPAGPAWDRGRRSVNLVATNTF